jgi:hypothetical protein
MEMVEEEEGAWRIRSDSAEAESLARCTCKQLRQRRRSLIGACGP